MADPRDGTHPQYSGDGRHYWTGTSWIPSEQVLDARPDTPVHALAPRLARWPPPDWASALALMLAVLLVAGIAGALVVVAHPGPSSGYVGGPAAVEVFDSPLANHVGALSVNGTLVGDSAAEKVTGTLEVSPARALHLTVRDGSGYIGEYLDANGLGYVTEQSGGPWQELATESLLDQNLGWTGAPPPAGLRVAGLGTVDGVAAWHLTTSSGSWWIARHGGRPLRFSYQAQLYDFTLRFGPSGSAAPVVPPTPAQLTTLPIAGPPHTVVQAPGAELEMLTARVAPSGIGQAPSGFHLEAVRLRFRNATADPIAFDDSFSLTGPRGAAYQSVTESDPTPALRAGSTLYPGQWVTGWDVFVVADGAGPLTLRGGPQGNNQEVDFLISIPLA